MTISIPKYFNHRDILLCGIYFLIKNHKIVYIGQTTNLHARLASHEYKYNTKFDAVRFIPCEGSKLWRYEKRWILKFKPKYNNKAVCGLETSKYMQKMLKIRGF